jgi:hypothetical protein
MAGERDDGFWADEDDPNFLYAAWTRPTGVAVEPQSHDAATGVTLQVLPGPSLVQDHLLRIERRVQTGLDVIAVLAIELVGAHAQIAAVRNGVRERLQLIRGAHVYDGDDGRFVLIVEWMRSRFEAMTVADRVHRRLRVPIELNGELIEVGASIGVRVSLDGAQHPASFVQDAEMALHEACRRGGGAIALWAPAGRVLVTGRAGAE